MQELTDRLSRLGRLPTTDPSDATVAADVARGRGALRRRRLIAASTAAVAVLALAGAGVGLAGTGGSTRTRHDVAVRSAHQHLAVRLVAYTGTQAVGFTVATVPQGYVVQGASDSVLDVALPGDTTPIDSFVDKLVVSLQSVDVHSTPPGTAVIVNGEPGTINVQQGVRMLTYTDGSNQVVVQAWSNVGLTDAQLVTFAEGVTVTPAAVAPKG